MGSKTIIRSALANLSGMAYQIGMASDDVIFTSDRPVVQWPSHNEEYLNRPKWLAGFSRKQPATNQKK